MRQLTITVQDDFYDIFINFLKYIPNVSIDENIENEIPLWQQEIILDRIKNSKPEDISWEDFKNKMD
ncbi:MULTISPECIES: hypothetical protein [Flavobacterium]|uniref:hypothetical protein n=1 Tax=Flavobacterium TaxID=237 RepID=UPI0021145003|nr:MULTISPECIES: hypothetical protein [Flavobacterium]UUF15561.1 hypothetical protein NLJ00_05455 [Flavobacterium panici]